jgi:hypothetical protein
MAAKIRAAGNIAEGLNQYNAAGNSAKGAQSLARREPNAVSQHSSPKVVEADNRPRQGVGRIQQSQSNVGSRSVPSREIQRRKDCIEQIAKEINRLRLLRERMALVLVMPWSSRRFLF